MERVNGRKLFAELEAWLLGYMAMPREYATVAALWAINTWVFQWFDAVPYLCISAETKGSGKTAFSELIGFLSKNARLYSDPTAAALYNHLEMAEGEATLLFDEGEKMSGDSARTMKSFFNSGYRKGGCIPRKMPGGVVDFPVFCPKLVNLIGDLFDTGRDRSICLYLTQGKPERKYRRTPVEAEAGVFVPQIMTLVQQWKHDGVNNDPVDCDEWLSGRDEEIWSPLLTVARMLDLAPADYARVVKASKDLTVRKTQAARKFTSVDTKTAEEKNVRDRYGRQAVRDLAAVLSGRKAMFSAAAVQAMRELPMGGWSEFRTADGLTPDALAWLVGPFGVKSVNVREGGRDGKQAKGYRAADVFKAADRLKAGE